MNRSIEKSSKPIPTDNKYDAFISYRREGGSETARSIKESLEKRGLRIFLDFDELKTGRFDEKLLNVISASPNFLLILSTGALDRCHDENDWLTREISHALKNSKNVIPVMKKGFDFSKIPELPEAISELTKYNGINYDDNYYNAFIDELVLRMGASHEVQSPMGLNSRKEKQKAYDLAIMGNQLLKEGKYDEAEQVFDESLNLDIDLSPAYHGKGLLSLLKSEEKLISIEWFRKASVLDPASGYRKYALSQVALYAGDLKLVVESLKGAINNDPANEEYRSLLDTINKKLQSSDEKPELNDQDVFRLVKLLIEKEDDSLPSVRWWITALPPWSWIKNRPMVGAALISFLLLTLVLLLNINTVSYQHLILFIVFSIINFLLLWMPFLFEKLFAGLYEKLKTVVTIPQSTFKRWFLAEGSIVTGVSFLSNGTNNKIRSFKKEDYTYLLAFFLIFLIASLLQLAEVSGFDSFEVNIGSAFKLFYYCIEMYFLAWVPIFVFSFLSFIPRFIKLPIRYFVGMPEFLSLKPLGLFYLKIAGLGYFAFLLSVIQQYLLRAFANVPLVSIITMAALFILFFGIMIFSQLLIVFNMITYKKRVITDFSYHIEDAYKTFMEYPTDDNFIRIKNYKTYLRYLKKELSISGLTRVGYFWLIFMSLTEVALLVLYFYLVRNNIWLQF